MNDYREIKNTQGYFINKLGEVLSIFSGYAKPRKWAITKLGYARVWLIGSGHKRVHRLVAETYLHKPANKDIINHKDGNTLNNSVDNLEWCTTQENLQHARQVLGRTSTPHKKLEAGQIKEIKNLLKDGKSHVEIARIYNVARSTITAINIGKSWS